MPRWSRTQNQPRRLPQDSLAEAAGCHSVDADEVFSDLADWIGEDSDLQSKLESFKKMVFKMLDGKKKTVTTDTEESVVPTESPPTLTPTLNKLKAVVAEMHDKAYSIKTPENKDGHKPADPAAVSKLNKGTANQAKAGKATPTQKAKGGWKCMECGKKMSLKTAQTMCCPKCGGADIDLD